ncbi:oxidoreductase [Sphaerisporangium siamense]|uniref:Aryl-alcohol dehydrogenase-like predicted oxidoreductase n=1 Tax=Sphaerisporangium siamense TaxID=795645 RepID=A0A7W7GBQ7_9ACTN|nr:aldo/keto reductase [Sphaerisporangium siamense]MBB4703090.1 aryl-alcohol dehydrogenase-like predicted oxidoreductase [Sphaerisporangium siamense]GII83144.1 oxidoreductase [Sphaerisporangium siamense]
MEYVRLGTTGMKVSRICLGMMSYGDPERGPDWVLSEDAARPLVRRAAEAGVNFFDTADTYSAGVSEEITGRLLREIFPRREQYVLATKVFFPVDPEVNDRGLSRKHIHAAIDASLTRLGTDYVDLYQIHRWDDATPIEETMEALNDLVRAGKVRYIGASSMYAWQFAKAQHTAERHGWTRFASMQPHYNLIYREEEREMIPLCLDQGVGLIPWSPLARGLLARAGAEDETARSGADGRIEILYGGPGDAEVLRRLAQTAGARRVPPAQVALAWLLAQPGVTAPIVGATKERHVDDAVAAEALALTGEELAYLAEPYLPRSVSI